jgi:hypothetical protein
MHPRTSIGWLLAMATACSATPHAQDAPAPAEFGRGTPPGASHQSLVGRSGRAIKYQEVAPVPSAVPALSAEPPGQSSTRMPPSASAAPVVPSNQAETAAIGSAAPGPPVVPKYTAKADPFERPPRATSPNCGPDERSRQAATLRSRDDFASFLRDHGTSISDWIELDDFIADGSAVDWSRVRAATKTYALGRRTVYELKFRPRDCAGFTLRMTNDGYTSLYGCCGK